MTIKTKIFTISALFCLVVIALVLPNHFLAKRTRELNLMILHVQHEHIAVQNLIILVGRELKEISDEIFLGDRDPMANRLADEIRSAFNQLEKFSRLQKYVEGESHSRTNLDDEEIMFKALKLSYAKMQTAKIEIRRLHDEGRVEEARDLMDHTYEKEYDANFRVISSEWLRDEATELQECVIRFEGFFNQFNLFSNIAGLLSIFLSLILSVLLYRFVSRRMDLLMQGAKSVAGGNLNTKLELSGKDELSSVAEAFNHMIEHLAESRSRLLEQCYLAGINEASADILHNIKSSFTHLLLIGEKLPQLIESMEGAEEHGSVPAASITELKRLVKKMTLSIGDVQQILRTTQKAFTDDQAVQECLLRDLINDSLNLLRRDYLDRIRIYIDPAVQRIGLIRTHRIIFIQILSNLITNACEAIIRQGEVNGMVSISAIIEAENGREIIHLFLRDNGCGILPNDLERIFKRHFSSKLRLQHGLTGLGLNWCQNAVSSLNGRIYAESAGAGKGTTIHMLFSREVSDSLGKLDEQKA